MNQLFAGFSAAIVVRELGRVVKSSIGAKIAIEAIGRSLLAATGTASQGAAEFTFVRSETDRLGLSLRSAALDYSQMAAASRGTKLEGQETRDVFTAVSESMTVLGRSAVDTSGAIRAITQVLSKGTVQAEEIRGQLGERLPGAFQIMARSLGKTTPELNKMLELGQVLAEDALPKFAEELRKTFSAGLADAMTSTRANLNRFSTAVFEAQALVGEGLAPAVAGIAVDMAAWLKQNDELLVSLGQDLGGAVRTLGGGIAFLAENVAALTVAFSALIAVGVVRWAAASTVGMQLLSVGTLNVGLAVRGLRAGYLSLFAVGVGAKIAAWLAPLKATAAVVATAAVGWVALAGAAGAATNVGVSAWSDDMSRSISGAVDDVNDLAAGLAKIGMTSELAAATGDMDKMTDALGSLIVEWKAAEAAEEEAARDLDLLRTGQGIYSEQLGELKTRLLEAERAYNAAHIAAGKYRTEVDELSDATDDLVAAQALASKILGVGEVLAAVEVAKHEAAVLKLAESWSKLLGEASPGVEILSSLANQQLSNERAADAAAEAMKREAAALEELHDRGRAAIDRLAELRQELANTQSMLSGLGAPDLLPDSLLESRVLGSGATVFDRILEASSEQYAVVVSDAILTSGGDVSSLWSREIVIAGEQVGATWGDVLGSAIRALASIAQDFGRREQGRLGGNVSGDFGGEGSALFGAAGGIAGQIISAAHPIAGAIVSTLGPIIGEIIGGAFKQGADEGLLSLRQVGEDVALQITRDEGGLGGVALQIGQAFQNALSGVEEILGGQIDIAGFDLKIRNDTISIFINGITGKFESIAEAVDFALVESLKDATFFNAGAQASPEVLQALQGFVGNTAESLQEALALAIRLQEGRLGPAVVAVENAIGQIFADINDALILGIDPQGGFADLGRIRDQLLGVEQDAVASKLAEIDAFNARLLVEEAGLQALLARVTAEEAVTRGRIGATISFVETSRAAIDAQGAFAQSMAATAGVAIAAAVGASDAVLAIQAALEAVQGLRVGDIARAAAAARAAAGRARRATGGGRVAAPTDFAEDLLQQLARLRVGTDEAALALFDFNIRQAALQEQIQQSTISEAEGLELLDRLRQQFFDAELVRTEAEAQARIDANNDALQSILGPFQTLLADTSVAGQLEELNRQRDEALASLTDLIRTRGQEEVVIAGTEQAILNLLNSVRVQLDSVVSGIVGTLRQSLDFLDPEGRARVAEIIVDFERQQFQLAVFEHRFKLEAIQRELLLLGEVNQARLDVIAGMLEGLDILDANLGAILDGIGESVAQGLATGISGGLGRQHLAGGAAGVNPAQAILDMLARMQGAASDIGPILAIRNTFDDIAMQLADPAIIQGLQALGLTVAEVAAQFDLLEQMQIQDLFADEAAARQDIIDSLLGGALSGTSQRAQFDAQQGRIMALLEQSRSGDAETRLAAQQQLNQLLPGFLSLAQGALGLGFGQFAQQFAGLLGGVPSGPLAGGIIAPDAGGFPAGLPGRDVIGTPVGGFGTPAGTVPSVAPFVEPLATRLDNIERAVLSLGPAADRRMDQAEVRQDRRSTRTDEMLSARLTRRG